MNGKNGSRALVAIASVVMLAAVISGIFVLGSPTHQRALKLDDQRTSGLSMLSSAINAYRSEHQALPAGLQAVGFGNRTFKDPVSAVPYEYIITGSDSYQLCAIFIDASAPDGYGERGSFTSTNNTRWQHPAGRHCFVFSIRAGSLPAY